MKRISTLLLLVACVVMAQAQKLDAQLMQLVGQSATRGEHVVMNQKALQDKLSVNFNADSTVVTEMSDTLNNVEAVERQVNAVYAYWNDLRQYDGEDKPCVDELFGSKEWWRVRKEVVEIDRACECGGFFDFGEEGPLDPWTYDCYEGYVSANDIKVKLQPDGTAEVNFLVKDAATPKGVPMRWLMCVEDGQWRVANIFFVKDDNMDILMNMREYVDDEKKKSGDPKQY